MLALVIWLQKPGVIQLIMVTTRHGNIYQKKKAHHGSVSIYQNHPVTGKEIEWRELVSDANIR